MVNPYLSTHKYVSSGFRTPATIARVNDRYVVVNADFATSTLPFTVSSPFRHDD
jgi:hypothetical protein